LYSGTEKYSTDGSPAQSAAPPDDPAAECSEGVSVGEQVGQPKKPGVQRAQYLKLIRAARMLWNVIQCRSPTGIGPSISLAR